MVTCKIFMEKLLMSELDVPGEVVENELVGPQGRWPVAQSLFGSQCLVVHSSSQCGIQLCLASP